MFYFDCCFKDVLTAQCKMYYMRCYKLKKPLALKANVSIVQNAERMSINKSDVVDNL